MVGAVPDGVPRTVAEAARGTLGGALAAAQQLPDGLGAGLVAAANAAFTQGLRLTAMIGAVLLLSIAIVAATLLRAVRMGSTPGEHADLDPVGPTAEQPAAAETLDPASPRS
jgi:DHA2 family multidrug resistance protein-like MFS transporter